MSWHPDLAGSYSNGMVLMSRRSSLTLAVLFVAGSFAIYFGAYFAAQKFTDTGTNGRGRFTVRYYATDWQMVAFMPAAAVESVIRREDVQVAYVFTP
jgi:hypothetical protein